MFPRSMGASQKYRLRARSDREVIREVEPGTVYVDRESGEEFEVVGKLLPLAPSPSVRRPRPHSRTIWSWGPSCSAGRRSRTR